MSFRQHGAGIPREFKASSGAGHLNVPRSVVDRLVHSGPQIEPLWQSLFARVRALHDEDRRHVLGGIVVPGGAVGREVPHCGLEMRQGLYLHRVGDRATDAGTTWSAAIQIDVQQEVPL